MNMPTAAQVSRPVLLRPQKTSQITPFSKKLLKKPMCSLLSHLVKPGVFVTETAYVMGGVSFGV